LTDFCYNESDFISLVDEGRVLVKGSDDVVRRMGADAVFNTVWPAELQVLLEKAKLDECHGVDAKTITSSVRSRVVSALSFAVVMAGFLWT
jgi:hypothetical protein